MIIFTLYNFKGGVGKTTSCVNLAYLSARDGFKTLLWDLDPQSSATYYLGEEDSVNGSMKGLISQKKSFDHYIKPSQYPNLSYIPGHIKNRNIDVQLSTVDHFNKQFKSIKSDLKYQFDYVFIDCPPSLSHLANQIFKSAHFVLMPLIPTTLSERTYNQVLDHFKSQNFDVRKILPFFSLVDNRKNLHRSTMEHFRSTQPKVIRSIIPSSTEIEKMGINRAPVYTFSKNSEGSLAYRNLWQELKWFKKLSSQRTLSKRK
jgi:cellulose biosynthesis protein BcsQ